jgi:adenylate cyclase class IV
VARNIEIKARIKSVESLLQRARVVAASEPVLIEQDDTFFAVAQGRLKLRTFADGTAELIHYERADTGAAKASDYVRVPVSDAAALREALARAGGVLGRVRKRRLLLLAGSTRIHLDRVEGLGDFSGLEVVMQDGQSDAEGEREAATLMTRLGLAAAPRVAGAYLDLLAGKAV